CAGDEYGSGFSYW
nr:immunoglobulin heavy chain junction region [Macaca mulatta]MOV38843.1 immunoglobulin heavy chain junction region [Macaca mulatta]MOV39050.1 immunoglobulin heavy chain junction region [Macaca mulatta]MOV40207.1 immunoglobulin heavy chain junction region [Macaca mulatta]MOV40214.1 immunoglobulin heavy chain junction region [Macaca mulatta]